MDVDAEIQKLLAGRCFANPFSGPDCHLNNFPKEIKALVENAIQEERCRCRLLIATLISRYQGDYSVPVDLVTESTLMAVIKRLDKEVAGGEEV